MLVATDVTRKWCVSYSPDGNGNALRTIALADDPAIRAPYGGSRVDDPTALRPPISPTGTSSDEFASCEGLRDEGDGLDTMTGHRRVYNAGALPLPVLVLRQTDAQCLPYCLLRSVVQRGENLWCYAAARPSWQRSLSRLPQLFGMSTTLSGWITAPLSLESE